MLEEETGARKWVPLAGAAAVILALCAGLYFAFKALTGVPPPREQKVQQISIVQPPPPPPPPPKTEPPPEPEEKIETPEEKPLETVDSNEDMTTRDTGPAAAGAGDGFGSGEGGFKRKVDLEIYKRWYAGFVNRDIQRALSQIDAIRNSAYSITVRIRIGEDGRVTWYELVGTTNDDALDQRIATALQSVQISKAPEAALPQPITLRIRSRI
ncbi:MAG: TonB C-terminal domain-containing protein [Gammaproteobacteria bacterium]